MIPSQKVYEWNLMHYISYAENSQEPIKSCWNFNNFLVEVGKITKI